VQIPLLILSLVVALVGTLAKTRDDDQPSLRRRVKASGWIIVGALLISFVLTIIETLDTARQNRAVKDQNKQLSENVSSLVHQQGETGRQVSSLLEQLGETQKQLSRERSATVLSQTKDWEIVRDVELRIECLQLDNDGDRARASVNPFWFTPGLANYRMILNPNSPSPGYLEFQEDAPTFDPAKDAQALSAFMWAGGENAKHTRYSAREDYQQHNFRLSGPNTLSVLLYEFRSGWGTPFTIELTYREPPTKETIEKLRSFVTDKKKLEMQILAPIEKKSALAERRKHLDSPDESNVRHVYWRVNIPLTAEKIESGVGEHRTANDVVISVRIESPFIEQDYDQEPGP
jgi:hypothetical protein